MIKKLLIAAVAVVVGLAVVTSPTWVGSLLRTKVKNATAFLKHQVTPETQIEMLRNDLARLTPELKKHFSDLAQEMVTVETLRKDVVALEAKLVAKKKDILALKEDVASDREFVTYGDRRYTKAQVKRQLAREFEGYKAAEDNLKAKRDLLTQKEEGLSTAREQLKAMQDARETLQSELARLEAEIKKVRVAQTRSKFHLDDSALSRVKAGVEELKKRIDVEKKRLELEAEFSHAPIPQTDRVQAKDLIKEIDNHFAGQTGKVVKE